MNVVLRTFAVGPYDAIIGDEAKVAFAENGVGPVAHFLKAGCWSSTELLGIVGVDMGYGAGGVWTLVELGGCGAGAAVAAAAC